MKKLLFACAIIMAGAFAFAGATPASAMPAAPVTGMSDIVTTGGTAQNVTYYGYGYRGGYCWRFPWRCRHSSYDAPRYRHYRYRHHRPWWW